MSAVNLYSTIEMNFIGATHLKSAFVPSGKRNYARSGQASQSSDYGNFDVRRANDGRLVSINNDGITHTQEGTDQWLKIELDACIYLVKMIVYNRNGECDSKNCGERFWPCYWAY